MRKLTTEEFIKRAIQTHKDKYFYNKSIYTHSEQPLIITCKIHGDFMQNPLNHINGNGCPICKFENQKFTATSIIEKFNLKHNNFYSYENMQYIDRKHSIEIICPIHGSFFQKPSDHLAGNGCQICGEYKRLQKRKLPFKELLQRFVQVHGDTYDYSLVKYESINKKVDIICKKHGVFQQTPAAHLNNQNCPICAKANSITSIRNVRGRKNIITDFKKVHGNTYDYSKVDFVSIKHKICIICKKHGEFFQTPESHLNYQGCPLCKQSKGEKSIYKLLIELNIKHIYQKTFDKCVYKKKLRFDFYLPTYNLCIEFDGKQHYEEQAFKKNITKQEQLKAFEEIKLKDQIKNEYCKNNNIPLLRIPYWEKDNINMIIIKYIYENYIL